ncbi:hypothetical protein ACFE04_026391 [Oxalis oulophora]
MTGGGRDEPPRTVVNDGEFILSLLQKPQPSSSQHQQQQQVVVGMDPAVAAVGPTVYAQPPPPSPPWTNNPIPVLPPHLLGFPQRNWNTQNHQQQQRFSIGGASTNSENIRKVEELPHIVFGSLNHNNINWHLNNNNNNNNNNVAKEHDLSNGIDRNSQFVYANNQRDNVRPNYTSTSSETRVMRSQLPNEFSRCNNEQEDNNRGRSFSNSEDNVVLQQKMGNFGLHDKHDQLLGSKLPLASGRIVQESVIEEEDVHNGEDLGTEIVDSLLRECEVVDVKDNNINNKKKKEKYHRVKDGRLDRRGQNLVSRGMRFKYSRRQCRRDILRLNDHFHAIYESLIPPEEVKANQLRLFTHLEKLVCKEWPQARLYLYGSCGNSFGVSKSDVDVCLSFQGAEINKSEVLLKLADILQSDNFQNVQALTHARVPIVKLMHAETGISCDICVNNLLAVVNTKLLRDYAQIDGRLRQLAFLVKHWAKSRRVNETYQGTLSSYAYVLMCIHFLQQRRPPILPCLQMLEPTYSEIIDDTEYAFYDRVERLCNYGSRNKETIAELVWGFFNFWAYRFDYTKDVISVRTGHIISKQDKDWSRRIGNDRHLICIEDPFEISHDLGRVVDKFSIKVLREEFERAAEVLQFDPNPCVTLFKPYVPAST